ncbi:MAG TPA: type 4a pilus biogenesis protein PilO [Gaiellaceae bacterium]|nr:type 4a pilus biogenesis protein PilO [Gaiellaceae bacterium]
MKGRKLPRGATIAMIVGGDLLLLLMGWFLLVSPQRSQAKSIARSVAATHAQIVEAAKPVTQPAQQSQPKQPEIRTAYLYKLSKAMPMSQDMPNLLLELSQVVRNSGVQLNSIAPAPPDPSGVSAITLSVAGDFYSLTDLVYRLRSLVSVHKGVLDVSGRLFTIKSVGLTPSGAGRTINAAIALSTYTFNGAAAPAATATSTPPSTDTTATTTTSTDTTAASADAGISH